MKSNKKLLSDTLNLENRRLRRCTQRKYYFLSLKDPRCVKDNLISANSFNVGVHGEHYFLDFG